MIVTDLTTRSRGGGDPVASGTYLAAERLGRYGVFVTADLDDITEFTRSLLASRMEGVPERAVELMAEQLGIAVLIRREYGEPGLTSDQVGAYLKAAERFFNSLWHDEP
jgi:hypothetical protein